MKKSLVLGLILALMCFSTVFASTFSDVSNHWAQSSIERMANEQISNGYDNGSYKPEDYITRAEAVAMIVRAFATTETADLAAYNDVDKDAWYYETLSKGVSMGIINGYGNGEMRPNEYVTRQEVIAMLNRVYKFEDASNTGKELLAKFEDSSNVGDWAQNDVMVFLVNNFVRGYENNTINPTGYIKRAEAATLLDRTIAKIIREPGEYDLSEVGNGVVIILAKDVEIKGTEGKKIIASTADVKDSLKTDLKDETAIDVVETKVEDAKEDVKEENKGSSSSSGSSSSGSGLTQTVIKLNLTTSGDKYEITKTGEITLGTLITVTVDGTTVLSRYQVADKTLRAKLEGLTSKVDGLKLAKTVSETKNDVAEIRNLGWDVYSLMEEDDRFVAFKVGADIFTEDEGDVDLIVDIYTELTEVGESGEVELTDSEIKALVIEALFADKYTEMDRINILNQIF